MGRLRSVGDRLDPVPAAPAAQPSSTPGGARGSAKLAVPDLHGACSGEHQLDCIPPVGDAADTDDRQVGMGSVHVEDRTHGDGMDRPSAVAASPGAQHGQPAMPGSITIPSRVLIKRDGLCAGVAYGRGDLDHAVGVGAELRPPWPAARRRRAR